MTYAVRFRDKFEIVDYAIRHSQVKASFKYGIPQMTVSKWVKDWRKSEATESARKRTQHRSGTPTSIQDTSKPLKGHSTKTVESGSDDDDLLLQMLLDMRFTII